MDQATEIAINRLRIHVCVLWAVAIVLGVMVSLGNMTNNTQNDTIDKLIGLVESMMDLQGWR